MTATPARIGFILEEFRTAKAETPSVKNAYGEKARESDDPVETYFDHVADAQSVADERQLILSRSTRRFTVTASTIKEALAINDAPNALPVADYTDPDRDAYRRMLVCEVGYDFYTQNSQFQIWG